MHDVCEFLKWLVEFAMTGFWRFTAVYFLVGAFRPLSLVNITRTIEKKINDVEDAVAEFKK